MSKSFEGKVAVVTGGAQGIGAAVVKKLAAAGARVVVADFTPKGEQLAEILRADGYEVAYIRTDVSSAIDTAAMIDYAESQFGGLDILVNSAGIFPRGTWEDTTTELWDRVMNVNLKGTFLSCQAAAPALIRRHGGAIVNIGSLHASQGSEDTVAYAASKGGVVTLTRNLAASLSVHQIRVNCVHPGWVASEGEIELRESMGQPKSWLEEMGNGVPLGGALQTADEIADAVLFLASDQAAKMTGQMMAVDGGMSTRRR